MAQRKPGRKPSRPSASNPQHSVARPSGQEVQLRRAAASGWELVHPRCAREREDDLAEIQAMLAAGETEIARDELIWLLEECHDYIAAHRLLGDLALADNDLPLARGHFGNAFRIAQRAIRQAGDPRPAPYRLPANQAFHESGKGLVSCLLKLGKEELAVEVAAFLLSCDPADPLAVRQLMAAAAAGGAGGNDAER